MKALQTSKLRVTRATHQLHVRLQSRNAAQWGYIKSHVEKTAGKAFSDSALTAYLIEAVYSSLEHTQDQQ